jgi:hypothetical protein
MAESPSGRRKLKEKTMNRTLLGAALLAVVVLLAAGAGPALAQDVFAFEGTQTYWTYAAKTKETLQNYPCDVTAVLQFLGGQKVALAGEETCGGAPRPFGLFGKMTRGGSVKLSIPDFVPIVDIVKAHTGCTVVGPFPKFHGMLRDGVLHAETHFYSKCDQEWPANDLFATPVDGPVHWKWTLNLEAVEP